MIRNSIKQIFRMKWRTFCFLLFMILTGAFLVLSCNLLVQSAKNQKEFEEQFTTIGTVEQEAASVSQSMLWDAEKKDYVLRQSPEYQQIYTPEVLDFEGADYIYEPEKRNYYASYGPEYELLAEEKNFDEAAMVVEFSPVEDCVPNESVLIDVTSVLDRDQKNRVWFCNHFEENPEPLYKDKTYIAYLVYGMSTLHGSNISENSPLSEYVPAAPEATQYDGSGNLMEEEPLETYYEVTDGFYETELGKRYLNLANSNELLKNTFPVTGTNATNLLMAFHSGEAYIKEGTDISEQEYEAGEKVCLVSEEFAEKNQLEIGDYVNTRLYYTNASSAASKNFLIDGAGLNFNLLTAGGAMPEVFEESSYCIRGIYSVTKAGEIGTFAMAGDEMIVPSRSIVQPNACNILSYGPMKANTTSFQIPNGKIDEFMEAWGKQKKEDITITFYDNGYTQLKQGMDNMRLISFLFSSISVIIGISLLLFYIHLFLSSEKERMVIERCMGLSKTKCKVSIASGILLIFLVGNIVGGFAGAFLSRNISADAFQKEYYDATYSIGRIGETKKVSFEKTDWEQTIQVSLLSVGGYLLIGSVVLLKKIDDELKEEPLYLLSEMKRE